MSKYAELLGRLDERTERMERDVSEIKTQLTAQNGIIDQHGERLATLEAKEKNSLLKRNMRLKVMGIIAASGVSGAGIAKLLDVL